MSAIYSWALDRSVKLVWPTRYTINFHKLWRTWPFPTIQNIATKKLLVWSTALNFHLRRLNNLHLSRINNLCLGRLNNLRLRLLCIHISSFWAWSSPSSSKCNIHHIVNLSTHFNMNIRLDSNSKNKDPILGFPLNPTKYSQTKDQRKCYTIKIETYSITTGN